MTGEEKVALLLATLPPGAVEPIIAHLSPEVAGRIRARMQGNAPTSGDAPKKAAREFCDMLRIAERPQSIQAAPPPGRPAPRPAAAAGEEAEARPDAVALIRDCPPEALARALRDERPTVIALVLGYLETTHACAVLKLLPPEARHDALARQAHPVSISDELVERILRLVLSRCRRPAEKPARPEGDDLVTRLAELIRSLGGEDRKEVLGRLDRTDPATAEKTRKQLYRFSDVLRLSPRTLQSILGEVDVKTIALALKGATQEVKDKILNNVSRRAQQNLAEQMDLMAEVPPAQVDEAQEVIVQILRRLDQEGQLTL